MTDQQPTAWEDINPILARRSAPPPAPPSQSLGLTPATPTEFRNELTACLALTAPVGMTEDARTEWLRVAYGTLKHLPADLLARGCAKARLECDHPSKIVPTIVQETDASVALRRKWQREDEAKQQALPRPGGARCTGDEAQAILEEFGLARKFASNRA